MKFRNLSGYVVSMALACSSLGCESNNGLESRVNESLVTRPATRPVIMPTTRPAMEIMDLGDGTVLEKVVGIESDGPIWAFSYLGRKSKNPTPIYVAGQKTNGIMRVENGSSYELFSGNDDKTKTNFSISQSGMFTKDDGSEIYISGIERSGVGKDRTAKYKVKCVKVGSEERVGGSVPRVRGVKDVYVYSPSSDDDDSIFGNKLWGVYESDGKIEVCIQRPASRDKGEPKSRTLLVNPNSGEVRESDDLPAGVKQRIDYACISGRQLQEILKVGKPGGSLGIEYRYDIVGPDGTHLFGVYGPNGSGLFVRRPKRSAEYGSETRPSVTIVPSGDYSSEIKSHGDKK